MYVHAYVRKYVQTYIRITYVQCHMYWTYICTDVHTYASASVSSILIDFRIWYRKRKRLGLSRPEVFWRTCETFRVFPRNFLRDFIKIPVLKLPVFILFDNRGKCVRPFYFRMHTYLHIFVQPIHARNCSAGTSSNRRSSQRSRKLSKSSLSEEKITNCD